MSESSFISWIQSQSQRPSEAIPVPVGDDMAVIRWAGEDLLLAAADQVIDGVHFDSRKHSPRQIGAKVMNRNLSDCAAMACLPAAALACVALARGTGEEYARELYFGIKSAADAFDCPIIGGDTGSWDGKLVMSVTILGRPAGIQPVRRSGASVGDFIYVTGPLGGSILFRHMEFVPRIALARDLAGKHAVHAMIDISDGLSRDLGHICRASGVGACLDASAIPIHDDARTLTSQDGQSPLTHALNDGEDHELIVVSPEALDLPCVGQITSSGRLTIVQDGKEQDLRVGGWEHRL